MAFMPGVGLAGTQLGIMQRLAVVDCSDERGQGARMANTEILHAALQLRSHEGASLNLSRVSAAFERLRGEGAVYE